MKIAYVNATMVEGHDGVTRVIYKLIEEAKRHDLEVIGLGSKIAPDPSPTVPIYKVPSVALPLQKAYRVALPGYRPFARTLRDFRPDIIHLNSPCTLGFSAMRYAQHFGIPVVATYHTHFPTYPRYYHLQGAEELTWNILRRFYNSLDRTFVPSPVILDELQQHGIKRAEYIPNGVDHNLFTPTHRSEEWRKAITKGEDKPIVLFVSRLVWEKELRTLAETYNILRTMNANFEFVVVGEGHSRKEFEAMMPGAHFLGYKSGTELATCYASSDIFVFPSVTETFGLVTVEAMSSGVVPVAARAGGAVGIIEDGRSGFLTEPRSAIDMARKIVPLLERPEIRTVIAKEAIRRSTDFHWDAIAQKMFTRYEEIIAQAGTNKNYAVAV